MVLLGTEFVYVFVLLISLVFGQFIKHLNTPGEKQLVCTSVGVVLVVCLCGWQAYHSVLCTAVTATFICFVGPNRKCHVWCFAFVFSYLAFFRLGYLIGFAAPTAFPNVVQLLLTLRLVGVSFEVYDSHASPVNRNHENGDRNQNNKPHHVATIPELDAIEIFQYAFSFIGLFTGPYYTYKTYHDMLQCKHSSSIPTIQPIVQRIKLVIPIATVFVLLSSLKCTSVNFFTSQEFYSYGYFYRLDHTMILYTVPITTVVRLRLYAAWLMAESVCISATLGAYPASTKPRTGKGPSVEPPHQETMTSKPVEYSYATIENINVYQFETLADFRTAIRYWNMTVQWWLKNLVYNRFPSKTGRTFVTFLVSCFWHGVYPSYFMSFLMLPIILLVEDWMKRFRVDGSWYDKISWLVKLYTFQCLNMAFMLQGFWQTITYWWSTHFLGFALTGLCLVIYNTCKPPQKLIQKVE